MDHVQILFKEYDTLRTEVIARQSANYQLVIFGGAVFAWFATHASGKRFWISLAALLVISCWLVFRAVQDINFIAKRIQELEQEINQLAGANLLRWETHWGSNRTGWLIRKKPEFS